MRGGLLHANACLLPPRVRTRADVRLADELAVLFDFCDSGGVPPAKGAVSCVPPPHWSARALDECMACKHERQRERAAAPPDCRDCRGCRAEWLMTICLITMCTPAAWLARHGLCCMPKTCLCCMPKTWSLVFASHECGVLLKARSPLPRVLSFLLLCRMRTGTHRRQQAGHTGRLACCPPASAGHKCQQSQAVLGPVSAPLPPPRYICMCVYICVCIYICIYVYVYVCMYMYIYVCIYIHIWLCGVCKGLRA